jgi:hypothetical protein
VLHLLAIACPCCDPGQFLAAVGLAAAVLALPRMARWLRARRRA